MTVTLTYKNKYTNDCDSTTGWTHVVPVWLEAAGYVNCVAGDIGKIVCKFVAPNCDTNYGTLISYDNTARKWEIATLLRTTLIPGATSLCIDANGVGVPDGSGAGTSIAGIISANRYFSSDGDVFSLSATPADATRQEYFYEELNVTDFQAAYCTIRFKTSVASGGLEAFTVIVYTDATDSITPGYQQTWKTYLATLNSAKTIDKIRLYAYEDAVGNVASIVYYDFLLFHTATFTFPHVRHIRPHFSMKNANLGVFGRYGGILQHGGLDTPTIMLSGDVLQGETWESGTSAPHFEYLLTALSTDVWSWFTCDFPRIKCKVMIHDFWFDISTEGDKPEFTWNLELWVHSLSSFDAAIWGDWEWIYGV